MRQAALFVASQTNIDTVASRIAALALAPLRWWKRRRTMVRLIDMDDHILADIGISREDVRHAMSLPLGVNADLILQQRALERSHRARGWRQS